MVVLGTSLVEAEFRRSNPTMDVVSGGKVIQSHLKRCRSPVASRLCDLGRGDQDDSLDNVRTNKRYLSEAMANDLSRLTVNFGAPSTSSTRGETPDRMQFSKDCDSPSLHSSMMSVESSPRCCLTPRLPEAAIQPCGNSSASPSASSLQSPMETDGGFRTPMTASIGPCSIEGTFTPTHTCRRSRLSGTNGNLERVPASPSDVQIGEDLRKTVMRRALMKNDFRSNEGKVPPTPLWKPKFFSSEVWQHEKRIDFQRGSFSHIPEHAVSDLGEVSSVQNFPDSMELPFLEHSGTTSAVMLTLSRNVTLEFTERWLGFKVLGTPPRMRTSFLSDA